MIDKEAFIRSVMPVGELMTSEDISLKLKKRLSRGEVAQIMRNMNDAKLVKRKTKTHKYINRYGKIVTRKKEYRYWMRENDDRNKV